MDAPRVTKPSPESFRESHRRSSRWLALAVVGTVVGVVLLYGAFSNASLMPTQQPVLSPEKPALHEGNIVIAVARTPGGPTEWVNWAQVISYLSEALGQPVVVRYLTEEDEAAGVIASEHVDLAFVCAQQYLDLVESGHARGLCTPLMNGTATSQSLLVVGVDSEFRSFADLRGHWVAVSDKSSLGGVAYMQYLADSSDVQAETYFSEIQFGDTMEANIIDLREGLIDATVVNSVQVNVDTLGLRVIEASPYFGNPPIVVSTHVSEELAERVQSILLSFDARSQLPDDSAIDGFVVLDPDEYDFANVLRVACDDHVHP
jgi:ABC-type phosphate/phosphonate transport system substrate-binding protein